MATILHNSIFVRPLCNMWIFHEPEEHYETQQFLYDKSEIVQHVSKISVGEVYSVKKHNYTIWLNDSVY